MSNLIPTIGLEVHAELKTNTKVFSRSENSFNSLPNSKVNVIDLGYPGTLPILNKEVINKGILLSLALHCTITKDLYFDRKNYFYPDLPKGYQISQKNTPIGVGGYLEITIDNKIKKIYIEEIHIEEDTCKSIHEDNTTLLNYNRAGVPLIEIVTKPCLTSGKEASIYMETLRELLNYLGVSDGKIEEGSMRCDANVSLKEENSNILGTKTEIKNIGSISNINLAINSEIERQKELLNNNETIKEETRRYDEKTGKTILMRSKETGNDYRYFPEIDIPHIIIDDEWINRIKSNMPILPNELKNKYESYGLNNITIKTLLSNIELCHFYESIIIDCPNKITAANILTGDIIAYLNKNNLKINNTKLTKELFIELLISLENGNISMKIIKDMINEIMSSGKSISELIKNSGKTQISDEKELNTIIKNIINNNYNACLEYKNNKDRVTKFMMGLIMKETHGLANPVLANKILIANLEEL